MRKQVLPSFIEIVSPALCIKCWIAMTTGIVLLFLSCGLPPKQQAQKILLDGINDESVVIRVNAAKGLKQINDVQGIKILYETLRSDDKNGIVAALGALYDLKETGYAPVIIELTDHKDPLVRAEAYRLVSIMDDMQCRDILVKGIQDKVAKIRKFSYLGLEKFKEKTIIRHGLQDIDVLVKMAAATALARLGEPDLENFVRNQLQVFNLEIWKQGLKALAEMGDTSAIGFIKESLNDAPWELRLAAVEALLILDNKEGVSVLKEALETGDPFVRVNGVQILNKYRISEGPDLLTAATKDEYINISVVAIEALAKYRQKESHKIFMELMKAPNPLVKIAAAAAFLQVE
ncbi:MAG: HEAT repeat domain-containing protein [bacterium]